MQDERNWFVGLPVPPGVWFEPLLTDAPGARPTHPEDLHVTLAFFGPTGEARALAAWSLVEGTPPPAFEVRLAGLERFGRRFSALGLIPQSEALVSWMTDRRPGLLEAAEAPADPRPPRPHITVARPRDRRALGRWADARDPLEVTLTLGEVALYTRAETRHPRFTQVRRRRL